MTKFAENLKNLRIGKNLTQYDLAQKLNITKAAISNYENSRRLPDYETLELIADYFNVNMDSLMGRNFYINSSVSLNYGSEFIQESPTFYNVGNGTSTSISEDYYKIDEPQFIVSESRIKKFFSKGNSDEQATGQAFDILENFTHLNEEGQEKLADYADDLVSSGKYKKHNQAQVGKEA